MNYQETLDWMFSRLPMYQRQGKTAFKKDLTNIKAFVNVLNNPQDKFKTIHVGGTNGKGSTSHMIASILQEAGYKVGLYTSPHLKSFTERIRINGNEITEEAVINFITLHKAFLEKQGLSFFEMTVGMAFNYFAEQKIDIAIIEVGLGGRLDSTNVITPEVSVITNIGLDHTQFLGETLSEVAQEKAGIIKKEIPIVIGEYQQEVASVFEQKARQMSSDLTYASNSCTSYPTDLLGGYQKNNVKTAIMAVKKLSSLKITEEYLLQGLANVAINTNLKGRWQIIQSSNPKVICDTGHNKEGLTYVLEQLQQEKYKKLHIVLGVVSDKNLEEVLPMFPVEAKYFFCRPNIPRGLSADELRLKAEEYGLLGSVYGSVSVAYKEALRVANSEDLVFIGGSTFVVAEIF